MFDLPFLGSDIITGFAGESDEDFEITRNNLEASGLSQIHTFPYSKRAGTIGASAENQVDDKIKEKRADIVKAISKKKLSEFINKNIGTTREILIEKHPDKNGFIKGVTRNYLTVITNSKDLTLCTTLQNVKITKYENGKLYGELIINKFSTKKLPFAGAFCIPICLLILLVISKVQYTAKQE